MLRRILITGGVLLAVSLMASASFARHPNPKKANKYQATIVTGVEACTTANTKAPGALMTDACSPVVASDNVCRYGDDGKGGGKVLAKAKDDIAISAKLKGMDGTCDGETLCAVSSVRTNSNNCADTNDCSTITQVDLPLGLACCLVEKGKCKIKTTVNSALPGALALGNATEFIIGEVGLKRTGGGVSFRAGLFLP